jgi:hypothetical protein
VSENDDVLYEATVAANLADLFNQARAEAVEQTANVLILVETAYGLSAYSNAPGPIAHFMASAYALKAVMDAYPAPLEDDGDED